MPIIVDPELEAKLRARADAEGISIDAYIERLVREDDLEIAHTEALLEQAAKSGDHVEWNEQEWERIEREAVHSASPHTRG